MIHHPSPYFLVLLCSFFSLCVGTTAVAQKAQDPLKKKQEQVIIQSPTTRKRPDLSDRIRAEDTVPANAIRVNVRYRKEYGYRGSTNAFGDVGPTSCDAFHIDAAAGDGSMRPESLISISSDGTMKAVGGDYVCTYLVSELPLNETIRISVTLPRVRDFRGVSTKSFDGRGNYTIGLKDQLIFPEIDYAKVDKQKGMNVTIVTTARNDNEARTLLKHLGMPFRAQ